MRYEITIDYADYFQIIRINLTEEEYQVVKRLCDASEGTMTIDVG